MNFQDYISIHKLNIPKICPKCGGKLSIQENGTIICTNPNCNSKVAHKFLNFFTILKVDGAGESFTEDMGNRFNTISELIKHSNNFDCYIGENGKKINKNLSNALAKPITLGKYIALFDINGFGEKKLVNLEKTNLFKNFYNDNKIDLDFNELKNENIDTIVSDSVKDKLISELNSKKQDMIDTIQFFNFEKENNTVSGWKLKNISFCFTGKACKPRHELEIMVIENGGTISSVKKGLSFLVTDDTESGSSKNAKAAKLGIPTITSIDFLKMVEKN